MRKIILVTFLLLLVIPGQIGSYGIRSTKQMAYQFLKHLYQKNLHKLDIYHPYNTPVRVIINDYDSEKNKFKLKVRFFKSYSRMAGWLYKELELETNDKLTKFSFDCYMSICDIYDPIGFKILCSFYKGRPYIDTIIIG